MSRINNLKSYFNHITRLLNNGVIDVPKRVKELVIIRHDPTNNKILGWEINGKEILFQNQSYLDVDEQGNYDKCTDTYELTDFSYHFEPNKQANLKSYRIDLKNGDLHANNDISGGAHYKPGQIDLIFDDFNLCLAITLALLYIKKHTYPLEDGVAANL